MQLKKKRKKKKVLTLEWLTVRLGLGEGELEFVEVGVLDNFSSSSFSGGVVANMPVPGLKNNKVMKQKLSLKFKKEKKKRERKLFK